VTGLPESSRLRAELVERRGGEVDGHRPDLTLQDVHTARIGISLFLFFLALIGVLAGLSLLTGESDDLSNTGERVVGSLWLVSAALFAAAGALLLRRPMTGRALGALGAVLVFGGVLLTVNPYFGAPVTAGAALAAVLGFAR
jgi:drug/metabolite transporter (DMT)-like permease